MTSPAGRTRSEPLRTDTPPRWINPRALPRSRTFTTPRSARSSSGSSCSGSRTVSAKTRSRKFISKRGASGIRTIRPSPGVSSGCMESRSTSFAVVAGLLGLAVLGACRARMDLGGNRPHGGAGTTGSTGPSPIVGEDPLEALELAARFAASYLGGREGLDPPVNDLPSKEAHDPRQDGGEHRRDPRSPVPALGRRLIEATNSRRPSIPRINGLLACLLRGYSVRLTYSKSSGRPLMPRGGGAIQCAILPGS